MSYFVVAGWPSGAGRTHCPCRDPRGWTTCVTAPQRAQRALGPGLVSGAAGTARGAAHLRNEICDDIQFGVLGRSVEYLGEAGAQRLNAFLAPRVSLAGSSLLLALEDDQHEDARWVLLVLHDDRTEQSRFRLLEGPQVFHGPANDFGFALLDADDTQLGPHIDPFCSRGNVKSAPVTEAVAMSHFGVAGRLGGGSATGQV